jgi:hypothetical protein
MSRVKNIIIEKIPIAEITIRTPVKIAFTSTEALDIEYLWKICSLIEEHGYDSNKLKLIPDKIESQALGHRKDGKIIYDGEKREINYSFMHDNLDDETKDEIKKLLENIPYVKMVHL